jgi:hypothetical protein
VENKTKSMQQFSGATLLTICSKSVSKSLLALRSLSNKQHSN